ncbi:hybrid sensor histidine kinase/response regulator [Schinkia azotoformans]|uniref:hybrid sensor histidine kinase/response regulator n=1 Tax=Schinkia azotoformans TaxID=1454 RepID=UPI002DB6B58D|nr:ATP-binding protein [Schinkia azotoformans]MEC1716358.1 ATP-binding protein [Schinkia azotoformans]MEC1740019.1 ATP-binding protein [Schinkia azotoformans]MEC1746344.1 ATP-binding protein [Schinkia azotoformans]MEC1766547.1 ATP-binding protein [Schinkia azotoformans]MEC1787329.1 ATP-binding protein [Schinkia azotoformans]
MKLKITATLILFIIIGLIFASYITPSKSTENLAKHGILNLQEYDFAQNGPVRLDGEWEFVPGKLVDSNYFSERGASAYVQVPSLWTKYRIDNQSVPKFTNATYRLLVKLPADENLLGIKTSNIRMSNALYVNGEKIGGSGMPGESQSYRPSNTPYLSFFENTKGNIEIIVHVTNYHYAYGGGIISSLYLGDEQNILELRQNALMYDWVTIAAFFMVGIYFLGFYLHFRRDKSLLYFSLFCFSVVLYSLTHGEKVLHSLFPMIPYGIFVILQCSSNLISLFLLAYFHTILRSHSNKKFAQVLAIIGMICSLSAFLPVQINSQFQSLYSLYFLAVILYVLYVQIKAIFAKTTGALYLFIGSVTLIMYFIVGTLNVMGNTALDILPPILPFAYLLMLSLFMAHRFADTYRKNEELSEQLLQVDKFKDEFLAKTSHEFKTPLHGMIAILQSILSPTNSSLTTQQQEKINFAIDKAKRLSSLVNDVLDLTKLKRKELNLEIKPIDLYSTIFVVMEVFSYMLQKDIKIINSISRDISFVRADENRLRQILYNLIDNAIKYTDQGTIELTAQESDGKIIISIRDTGRGIASADINKVFHAFERVGDSNTEYQSVGLGLSITKQLVELQGGQIWARSTIGEGSTFSFSLPAVERNSEAVSSTEEGHYRVLEGMQQFIVPYIIGDPKGKKIMIVDDNHSNLRVLIEALNSENYFIIAVDNGKDVFTQLEQHPDMDLILLDIMMPGLNGFEVCKKIREKYSLTELPVLMLTAAILAEDMVAGFQAGANDFLHKPIELSELKTRMKNLILMKDTALAATAIEMAYLQAQIKPHFIYNVLNSILSLSYLDIEKTRALITNFAIFLRGSFVFTNTNKLIPIHNEISLVKSYVEIEKARFPEKFDFVIDRDIDFDCLIPPLLIQPLVENAIRHGIGGRRNGGQISLYIRNNKDTVTIKVTDNGRGISQEKINQILTQKQHENSGVGLLNIVNRIKKYSGATFSIESEEHKGTTVMVIIPYMTATEKEDVNVKSTHNR